MEPSTSRRMTVGDRERYKRPFDLTVLAAALVLLFPLWVLLGVVIARADARISFGGRQTHLIYAICSR